MEHTEKHTLHLENRSDLVITGVSEVLSFDEGFIDLSLGEGSLSVDGRELRISEFDSANGRLSVTGTVCALTYGDSAAKKTGGFFKRRRG